MISIARMSVKDLARVLRPLAEDPGYRGYQCLTDNELRLIARVEDLYPQLREIEGASYAARRNLELRRIKRKLGRQTTKRLRAVRRGIRSTLARWRRKWSADGFAESDEVDHLKWKIGIIDEIISKRVA